MKTSLGSSFGKPIQRYWVSVKFQFTVQVKPCHARRLHLAYRRHGTKAECLQWKQLSRTNIFDSFKWLSVYVGCWSMSMTGNYKTSWASKLKPWEPCIKAGSKAACCDSYGSYLKRGDTGVNIALGATRIHEKIHGWRFCRPEQRKLFCTKFVVAIHKTGRILAVSNEKGRLDRSVKSKAWKSIECPHSGVA